jgi:DNA-binding LacI/PurR family transcriptional regulator
LKYNKKHLYYLGIYTILKLYNKKEKKEIHIKGKKSKQDMPKYKVISEDIRNKIKNKVFTDNRLPSERKLSLEYNVNRITLRKALKILFEERLIAKLGAKGTYITSGELRPKEIESRRIAYFLIRCKLSDTYHGAVLNYIQQELQTHNSSIMFYCINTCEDIAKIHKANAISKEFDGIIIDGTTTPEILQALSGINTPIVLIGYLETPCKLEKKYDQVVADTEYYTSTSISSLVKSGHRRIAFIDGPAYQWSQLSQIGYMKALAESGIEYNEDLVFRVNSPSVKSALALTDTILKHAPTALFIRDQNMARGIYDGLISRNIKIPEEITIIYVGHPDDSVSHLGLPHVILDPSQIAQNSLALLFKRLSYSHADIEKRYLKFASSVVPHQR